MSFDADFKLRLINRISNPAKEAKKSILGITSAAREARRSLSLLKTASNSLRASQHRTNNALDKSIRKVKELSASYGGLAASQRAAGGVAAPRVGATAARGASRLGPIHGPARPPKEKPAKFRIKKSSDLRALQVGALRFKAARKEFFEAPSLTGLAKVNTLAGTVGKRFMGIAGALKATPFGFILGAAASGLKKVASMAFGVVKAFLRVGTTLAKVGVAIGALSAVVLTGAIIKMGIFQERAKKAFFFLGGKSKTAASEALATASKTADELGLNLRSTTEQMMKLRAAQFTLKGADEIVRMSADLRAVGADALQVKMAVRAITQIKGKGRLQAEELVGQLAEAGVSTILVYEQLEKRLGKTRKEVISMITAGKVGADLAVAAIKDAVKAKTGVQEAGEAAKKFADQTLAGLIARIRSIPGKLLADVSAKSSVHFDRIKAVLGRVREAMKSIDPGVLVKGFGLVVGVADKLVTLGIEFSRGFGVGIKDLLKQFGFVDDFTEKARKFELVKKIFSLSDEAKGVKSFKKNYNDLVSAATGGGLGKGAKSQAQSAGKALAKFFAMAVGLAKVAVKGISGFFEGLDLKSFFGVNETDSMKVSFDKIGEHVESLGVRIGASVRRFMKRIKKTIEDIGKDKSTKGILFDFGVGLGVAIARGMWDGITTIATGLFPDWLKSVVVGGAGGAGEAAAVALNTIAPGMGGLGTAVSALGDFAFDKTHSESADAIQGRKGPIPGGGSNGAGAINQTKNVTLRGGNTTYNIDGRGKSDQELAEMISEIIKKENQQQADSIGEAAF